jgi:acyl-CoA reductase-like NAD-dependent aldehyde dehydrogenase
MIGQEPLLNFVGGHWEEAAGAQTIPVRNPATGEVLAAAPLSTATDVAKAVKAASSAWQGVATNASGRSDPAAVPPQGTARRQLQ